MAKTDQLLAQLERDPTDDATGRVLVDALLDAGDPRGELAQLGARVTALRALVDKLDVRDDDNTDGVRITRGYGLVQRVDVSVSDDTYKAKRTAADMVAKALAQRDVRLSPHVGLYVRCDKHNVAAIAKDLTAALTIIAARAVALRELEVDLNAKAPLDIDLAPVVDGVPIRELSLAAAPEPTCLRFVAGTHPALERLTFESDDELDPAKLKRLFDGVTTPALKSLKLEKPELLKKLFAGKLAARLEVLDIGRASEDSKLVKALIAAKPKLAQLDRLVVGDVSMKDGKALQGFCRAVDNLPTLAEITWTEREIGRRNSAYGDRYEEISE